MYKSQVLLLILILLNICHQSAAAEYLRKDVILPNPINGNATIGAEFAWDIQQANTSLWIATAAYCGKDAYFSHTFKGPTEGFLATYIIYDRLTDTEGYIGVLPSDKSIFVAFRGSESLNNWIVNFDTVKTAYDSFPDCNCKVHKGFYDATLKVSSGVIAEVNRLKRVYPSYTVKVTGHSLGAALAHLQAMELIKNGINVEVLYNFGQPRVGDSDYAAFAKNKLQLWRVVHNKDVVPHLPQDEVIISFEHTVREQFEDANHNLKSCDPNSGEDPTCSDQFKAYELNTADHLLYLGLQMGCSYVS